MKNITRYLQEYTALGTAGGIYHFRDQILAGNPEMFFVMNADVCGDFPLIDMLQFHREKGGQAYGTILATEVSEDNVRNIQIGLSYELLSVWISTSGFFTKKHSILITILRKIKNSIFFHLSNYSNYDKQLNILPVVMICPCRHF